MNRRSFFSFMAAAGSLTGLALSSKIKIEEVQKPTPLPPSNIQATQPQSISSFYYPEKPPLVNGGHPVGSLWFNTEPGKNLELSVWNGKEWIPSEKQGVKNVTIRSF